MNECIWLKLCLTMLFLVDMLQVLSFWMTLTPLSSSLLVLIKGFIKENANNKTCEFWDFILLFIFIIFLQLIELFSTNLLAGEFLPLSKVQRKCSTLFMNLIICSWFSTYMNLLYFLFLA